MCCTTKLRLGNNLRVQRDHDSSSSMYSGPSEARSATCPDILGLKVFQLAVDVEAVL